MKQELAKVRAAAEEMPGQFRQYFQRACTVVQHHTAVYESNSSNITGEVFF